MEDRDGRRARQRSRTNGSPRNEAPRASKNLDRALLRRRWAASPPPVRGRPRAKSPPKLYSDEDATSVKLLGQRLMAQDFDLQVAEVRVRLAVLNGDTALGISVTKVTG